MGPQLFCYYLAPLSVNAGISALRLPGGCYSARALASLLHLPAYLPTLLRKETSAVKVRAVSGKTLCCLPNTT